MKTFNILESPIEVRGLAHTVPGQFWRLPPDVIETINPGTVGLAKKTAGGRVRFRTDAPEINVKFTLTEQVLMSHMPLTASSSIDCYVGHGAEALFCGVHKPKDNHTLENEVAFRLKNGGKPADVTINLPVFNGLSGMELSVDDAYEITAPLPYSIERPLVFYGSSITHGGCASRPSNTYNAIIARTLDADFVNLGFSGNARGEVNMAKYIADLGMSVFIYDYDHNAPNVEHLWKTHKPFFDIVREKNPKLPIVIATRPDFYPNRADSEARRAAIRATYDAAVAAGDKHVYFADGEQFYKPLLPLHDLASVDGCHPNDLGFHFMALSIGEQVKKALEESETV